MRTLIIPDLHNNLDNAEYWLGSQTYDRVVFLGDYFDHFDDNANDARKTAFWLRSRMDSADDIFLLGNHDAAYMFPNSDELYCPGFTKSKAKVIHEILKAKHWQRLKLAHEEQGWLLSHAGFHLAWMEEATIEKILARCQKAMDLVKSGKVDPILGYGQLPGGIQRFAGPLWMAWEYFMPIVGINQIVGHSPDDMVRKQLGTRSENWCIDVGNGSVAVLLTDGKPNVLKK